MYEDTVIRITFLHYICQIKLNAIVNHSLGNTLFYLKVMNNLLELCFVLFHVFRVILCLFNYIGERGYHRRKLRNRIFKISESINSKHTNSVMNEFCLKLLVKWNLIKCFVSHLLQLLTTV